MSKVVLVCPRDPLRIPEFEAKLRRLSSLILPDDFTANPMRFASECGVITACYHPADHLCFQGASVCHGVMLDPASDWWQPAACAPDGNYTLYRVDQDHVEVVNDVLSSRSVRYVQTDDLFIASNSQRAMSALLGTFELNREATLWMLSSGVLGIGNSWDKRIQRLAGNARLLLDKRTWTCQLTHEPLELAPVKASDEEHIERAQAVIQRVFASLNLDSERWALLLSGGADSRLLRHYLPRQVTNLTYGVSTEFDNPTSDSSVAKQVSEAMRLPFRFWAFDQGEPIPFDEIVRRFLARSEGRGDRLNSYMDGFRYMRQLASEGFAGVFQGDHSLDAGKFPHSEFEARQNARLYLLSDYANLPPSREFDLRDQTLPDELHRRIGESILDYSERLHQQFRYPVRLSNMTDTKSAYLEVVNPLAVNSVVRQLRTLPSHLRAEKRIFQILVATFGLDIPYASGQPVVNRDSYLRQPAAVQLLRHELQSSAMKRLFSERLLEFVLSRLETRELTLNNPGSSRRQRLFARLPAPLQRWHVQRSLTLSINVLAWRAVIISRMEQMLSEDARLFHS